MGLCHGKPIELQQAQSQLTGNSLQHDPFSDEAQQIRQSGLSGVSENKPPKIPKTPKSSKFPFYSPSPLPSLFKNSPAVGNSSSVNSTPLRIFKRPFPPPSPAKHIKAFLAKRYGAVKPNEVAIPEGGECEIGLDKNFGFSKQFVSHYEMGEEIGRGHFGYTCSAKAKKGSLKGLEVAVKVIPKSKRLENGVHLFCLGNGIYLEGHRESCIRWNASWIPWLNCHSSYTKELLSHTRLTSEAHQSYFT